MFEIKIGINCSWNDHTEELIQRVADCVLGRHVSRHNRPLLNSDKTIGEGSYQWELDSSNDWKAEIRDNCLIIAYRYGGVHEDMMMGLKSFLEWELK